MIKTGIDMVYIPKMQDLMKNEAFVNKVFHKSEAKKFTPEHLAGVFAAKEAFFKAANSNIGWLDIEIKNERNGKPKLELSNIIKERLGNPITELSISHEKEYAFAQVIVFKK